MRYLITLLFICMATLNTKAECQEVTYYSQKEYIDEYLYIDTSFNETNSVFVNSDKIITRINALGTHSHPLTVKSSVLVGNETIQVKKNHYEKNFFSISFSEAIKISELEFNINGYDSNGQSISKSVYVGGYLDLYDNYHDGTYVMSTNNTSNNIVNMNDILVSNLFIFFDSYDTDDIYELNYFQINKYKTYKHYKWTTDIIPNTETYKDTVCLNVGEFTPNGNNKYKYEDYTSLKVDSSLISDYKPVLKTSNYIFDYGRGGYISAYTKPMIVRNVDQYAKDITDFSYINGSFVALNKNQETHVRISNREVIKYKVLPSYWSSFYYGNVSHMSNNSGWCKHVTGNPKTPCYKYNGHTGNSRLNVYDVIMYIYENNVAKENQILKTGTYYLLNKETNVKEKIIKTDNSNLNFHINKTGLYTIYGELEDNVGNKNTIESNIFYIDQLAPSVIFNPNYNGWTNRDIKVTLVTNDFHSGVKDIYYKLNDDIYKPYNNPVIISEEGHNIVLAHVLDNVLNETIKSSVTYKIDKTPPVVEYEFNKKLKIEVYDELSKLNYFQYAISLDGGISYSSYSNKYTQNSIEIELEKDAAVRVKVRAYDNANNEFIKESDLYETYKSKASINKLFSYSYEKNIDNQLLVQLNCHSCRSKEERIIKLYSDNILVESKTIKIEPNLNTINLTYNTSNDFTNLKIEVYKVDKLEGNSILKVYAKTNRYIQSYDNVEFNEIVASYIEDGKVQDNYHESLTISPNPLDDSYYQGQGINVNAKINYTNECDRFNNFICERSNKLNNLNIYAIFDNGTTPIRDHYLDNNKYYVNMIKDNDRLVLPVVYVDKYTGEVYKDYQEHLIYGNNRWYLDKDLSLGTYDLCIQSKNIGYNNLSFDILLKYQVNDTLSNQYNIRFINPNNPYLDNNSIWKKDDYHEILKNIK